MHLLTCALMAILSVTGLVCLHFQLLLPKMASPTIWGNDNNYKHVNEENVYLECFSFTNIAIKFLAFENIS